jgi:endo-beta-N-acetylglucosaminidase D
MNVSGWKEILRPIRDGFKHYFPSPDTGPTPEERIRQRKLDALKGFTYFDTFNQLEGWTPANSDPIQRANTPLLPRPASKEESTGKQSANVLLCHDYSGNYHDYECSQGAGVEEESYSCEYLQFVEIFVYFSHKLVCIPPPAWTNTLHRNGVKVLGTFLVEPALRESNRMLENSTVVGVDGTQLYFPFAAKLAAIAQHYGFDGWLINIEKPFGKSEWNLDLLLCLLSQLRSSMGPHSKIIWSVVSFCLSKHRTQYAARVELSKH